MPGASHVLRVPRTVVSAAPPPGSSTLLGDRVALAALVLEVPHLGFLLPRGRASTVARSSGGNELAPTLSVLRGSLRVRARRAADGSSRMAQDHRCDIGTLSPRVPLRRGAALSDVPGDRGASRDTCEPPPGNDARALQRHLRCKDAGVFRLLRSGRSALRAGKAGGAMHFDPSAGALDAAPSLRWDGASLESGKACAVRRGGPRPSLAIDVHNGSGLRIERSAGALDAASSLTPLPVALLRTSRCCALLPTGKSRAHWFSRLPGACDGRWARRSLGIAGLAQRRPGLALLRRRGCGLWYTPARRVIAGETLPTAVLEIWMGGAGPPTVGGAIPRPRAPTPA
ncbi:hypothetical protein AURDEDRAFT_163605 [Auricularia subglabra TFB-10046 SS5]|nr:hypothetical protein AURDEDRAFT_163605 [Auricularia subglabra TFB-10046 SS5]